MRVEILWCLPVVCSVCLRAPDAASGNGSVAPRGPCGYALARIAGRWLRRLDPAAGPILKRQVGRKHVKKTSEIKRKGEAQRRHGMPKGKPGEGGGEAKREAGRKKRRADGRRACRHLPAAMALAARRAVLAATSRVPGTAFRRRDLVAAERGVQQRRESGAASLRKHAAVDHLRPGRGQGHSRAGQGVFRTRTDCAKRARRAVPANGEGVRARCWSG